MFLLLLIDLAGDNQGEIGQREAHTTCPSLPWV